ncbi:MAG: citrate (Si)-synthase [Lentisphaerae bacterium RIFOXYB12_FULL_65_16]|nr:MAG: citrate (Si)-synthase [Lentisphaerae bacterium RIFOXYA12_64_32]OGV86806.1 MAG: citrate (Si)-synthase [Lentisphaerae bacterium RIFOXYB12_FULL_65_16]
MTQIRHAGTAELRIGDKTLSLPIVEGSEGERAIDIGDLRTETGLVTLDYGYKNTASCKSAITFLDGECGVLRYRGYPIEVLAENFRFVDVAYLLVHGQLPSQEERSRFSELLNWHSMIHEDMRHFFYSFPEHAHPMAILSAMVVSLSTFYPELAQNSPEEEIDMATTRLLSKIRTIAAFSYKKSIGEPFVYPRHDLKYCANFLNMMFSSPVRPYEVKPEVERALNVLLVLHADHEQNCSTSTVRLVGSARVNLYAAVSAGICALWGPLHGGANQAVIEMLEDIQRDGGDVKKYIERAKDKTKAGHAPLYGFGHRVYKSYDPRAKIIKEVYANVLKAMEERDPLLDIATELEERAMADNYFLERKLFPNVDFYSGLTYRAIGIPKSMFTVMFALGRIPGWIAHWREAMSDPEFKLQRPRQIYVGPLRREYTPPKPAKPARRGRKAK